MRKVLRKGKKGWDDGVEGDGSYQDWQERQTAAPSRKVPRGEWRARRVGRWQPHALEWGSLMRDVPSWQLGNEVPMRTWMLGGPQGQLLPGRAYHERPYLTCSQVSRAIPSLQLLPMAFSMEGTLYFLP
jgi:hypothetical protein